tara:strand:- start:4643 stop:7651 length:3009 start_codon:yes stop_codon:yes gene_type:complete
MAQHTIYNIPVRLPFSETLARYLLDITQGKPESLTQFRLLLPTRRACRILQDAFLRLNDGKPMLLPHMMPLGEVDEDELSLLMFGQNQDCLDIPAAITPLKRQLLLAKLILRVPEFQQDFDGALKLSKALCQFIDQVVVEGLDFADLHKIVPESFAEHWQITLNFLKIISEFWPDILKEHNVIDMTDRRNRLLHALADYWAQSPPDYPVIAAGSTGSIPAAAKVLGVIASMPEGKVVLPGLDDEMDDESWECITETHPQYSLKSLLGSIGAERQAVSCLVEDAFTSSSSRHKLASAMMLPAETTHQWKDFAQSNDLTAMLAGLEYYSCKTPQEEADIIALIMRESLEIKAHVTALVTPDRALARRVKNACQRWGIDVDDSAGENLAQTKLGKFILLTLEVAKPKFDPVSFLSLLKSNLCLFGYPPEQLYQCVKELERRVLRSGAIISSHDILRKKVEALSAQQDLKDCVHSFYAAAEMLCTLATEKDAISPKDLLSAHIEVLESLAESSDVAGASNLWKGDVGKAGAQFFTNLLEHAYLMEDVTYDGYVKIITSLLNDVTVRVPYGLHPRILILGQLEARLTRADTVILGGVNEGVWSPSVKHDPWMSRPMRRTFGLPAIDQSIGFAAHDFVQNFCAQRVVMTRAEKSGGAPTIPSRWLERLDTLLGTSGMSLDDLSVQPYLSWARMVDHAAAISCPRPQPCPPVSTRPQSVSVTKVDTWLKDPYAIYMHYVLKLRKIRPLRQDNDAALKGNILHEILEKFVHQYPKELPADAEEQFLTLAKTVILEEAQDQDLLHYWWPKLIEIARWFIAHEQDWRTQASFIESEIKGNIDIEINGSIFNLYGVADRVDRYGNGYALIDYKSGGTFSPKGLTDGKYPQLPLEAMILAGGGFDGRGFKHQNKDQYTKTKIAAVDARYLGYWKMTGGQKSGDTIYVEGDFDETVATVRGGLENLVVTFQNPETPFYCIPDSNNAPRFNDYERVSRLKEWGVSEDADEGDAYES